MPTGRLVRISEENLKKLAEKRQNWETPDQCMKRILSENPCKTKESEEVKDHKIESENQQDE